MPHLLPPNAPPNCLQDSDRVIKLTEKQVDRRLESDKLFDFMSGQPWITGNGALIHTMTVSRPPSLASAMYSGQTHW